MIEFGSDFFNAMLDDSDSGFTNRYVCYLLTELYHKLFKY